MSPTPPRDDLELVFDSDRLVDVRLLAERIKEHVGALLRAPLQARYDAGQTLTFGPLSVSRESIGEGSRQVTWSQVQNVAVKNGRLIVTPKQGSQLMVRTHRIPNIELLGELIGIPPSDLDLVYV